MLRSALRLSKRILASNASVARRAVLREGQQGASVRTFASCVALAGAISLVSVGGDAARCNGSQPKPSNYNDDMRPPSSTPSRPTASERLRSFLRGKSTEAALNELDDKEREASKFKRRIVYESVKAAYDAVATDSDGNPVDPDGMILPERLFVADLGWRLARAAIQLTQEDRLMMADERQRLLELAEKSAATSVQLKGDNAPARRFYGIAMNATGEFSTTSDYIAKSYKVKEQWLKAVELDPKDPNARHLIGRWCYDVANMSSFTRNIAAMVFRTPPTSSFEEALKHFKAAEDLKPGFWKSNVLYMGMCQYQLGRTDEAKAWISKAISMPNQTSDDEVAHKEAISWKSWLGM